MIHGDLYIPWPILINAKFLAKVSQQRQHYTLNSQNSYQRNIKLFWSFGFFCFGLGLHLDFRLQRRCLKRKFFIHFHKTFYWSSPDSRSRLLKASKRKFEQTAIGCANRPLERHGRSKANNWKRNHPTIEYLDTGLLVPGAFKLDHLQPFNSFTFILGSQFLLPQRANNGSWENFPFPIWIRLRGFSAWGIQTGPLAAL